MSAIEQLAAIYPKCRTCGAEWIADTEIEALECLGIDEAFRDSIPKHDLVTYDKVHNIGWVCARCSFMSESQRRESERRHKINMLTEETFGYGRMPRVAMLQNWTHSTKDAEAQNPESWATARAWRNECSFWIQGTKGTGKTFMGRCLLNWALDQGLTVYEVSSVDFVEWVYREGEKQRRDVEQADVIMIDDIDKPEWRIDAMVALWRMIDIRSSEQKKSIITGNVSAETMKDRWLKTEGTDRQIALPLFDRMRNFERLTLQGKSLRGID